MAGTKPIHAAPPANTPRRRIFRRSSRPTAPVTPRAPWWVTALTDVGRPVVAAVVLVMCAPGEHHLGTLAGWGDKLAWGMAGVLAAYAGIAAAVASKRPKGAPGRFSAIVGAWLALAAGMSAQPVSHMFVTGHWSAEPAAPVWLVITVSCVPPLVLGHLLHLAATPIGAAVPAAVNAPVTPVTGPAPAPVAPAADPAVPPTAAVVAPPMPAAPPVIYADARCAVIRPLYETGRRPGTKAMGAALAKAGYDVPSDGTIRGAIRAEIERHEPHLAQLPPAPVPMPRHAAS